MAHYQTHLGSFQSPQTTGSQAYTGVTFQPKALLIWSANDALLTPPFGEFNYWSGSMTDGTNHVALTSISYDNQATTEQNQGVRTDSVILAEDTGGNTQHRATFTSFDSDGFTLNWTNIFGSEPRYYNYVAIGGDEVEVEVGEFNSNTATGSQAFSGLAFTPTGVVFMPAQNSGTSEDRCTYPAIGYTDGVNQGASYVFSEDGAAASNTKRYQRINKCIALGSVADGSVLAEAGLTSFDDDGFTLDWTTAPASAIRCFYLAFTGIPFATGVMTQPSSSGSQSTTGLGFRPGVVLIQSVNAAASTSVQDQYDFSIGGGSATESRATWLADNDGADPTESSRYYSHDLVYAAGVVAATASVLACSATLTSLDYDGFTLAHTADGTQRQILYAAWSSEYSHRNLIGGQGHVIIGHDNLVSGKNNTVIGNKNSCHGENGTVKGNRSALFNMDGVTRTLTGDDQFAAYGSIGGDIAAAEGGSHTIRVLGLAASATINVNSTGYVALAPLEFSVDTTLSPFTEYRLIISGSSNQGGQTITAQLATGFATPTTPVHSGGDDLVMTNTGALWDSGYLTKDVSDSGLQSYIIALKGSNGTVDIAVTHVSVILKR